MLTTILLLPTRVATLVVGRGRPREGALGAVQPAEMFSTNDKKM